MPPAPRNGGEMTFEEIARELGVSRGRAQQYYESALKKLRRFVKQDEDGEVVFRELIRALQSSDVESGVPSIANVARPKPRRVRWVDIIFAPTEQRCPRCGQGILARDSYGHEYCVRAPAVLP